MTDEPVRTALNDFVQRLRGAARSRGLEVTDAPELLGSNFSGNSSRATTLDAGDLPSDGRAIRMGRYTVIVGALPETPTLPVVREVIRRFRNQCVVARSFLTTNQSLDLQVFLIGPRGSEWEKKWRALGLFIERDDRVARKLAWLRPRDPLTDDASFDDFQRRTFLARPWEEHQADLPEEPSLDLEKAAPLGLPRTTAEDFDRIALEADDDTTSDQIVDSLVRAWERRITS